MKKKRIIFPEKIKQWIDARTKYKLSHAQIEMARELGMEPKKFDGIASYLHEHSTQSLGEFIEASYKERFGKDAPDDRRSIEQKLKAEHAKTEAKRLQKAQGKAAAKWEALPESEKTMILESIWCDHCMKTTTITGFDCQTINDGLIISGRCATCDRAVGRYIEGV